MLILHPKPNVELLVVEVPEDAKEFSIEGNELLYRALMPPFGSVARLHKLPPGNYSFIATSRDITEEQAAELVESGTGFSGVSECPFYKNYLNGQIDYASSENSFESFLLSQGLSPCTKNYAICLKK